MSEHGGSGPRVTTRERRLAGQHFPAVSEVDAYWTALRDGAPLPARARIDPRGIERALAHAFVLERLAPGVARFRLAGLHLSDLMGMEVRGMPLTALFLPEARAAAAQAAERAFTGPARVTLHLAGETGIGRPPLQARMVLLPLLEGDGTVARLLGALQATGPIGRSPRRLLVGDTGIEPLVATAPRPQPPALAEPPRPLRFRPRSSRAHLRLVRTGPES